MASFTLTLHQVIELTDGDIGLDDYPIFDEVYRETLNGKIRDHFLNQEIAHETISMFQLAMRRKMNEIMPLYNQLYKSQMEFDPLQTVNVTNKSASTGTAESAEDSDSTSASKSEASARASEFPQVRIGGNKDYATSGQDNVSATEAVSNGKAKSTTSQDGTVESTTTGFQGNRAALLNEYRATFLNPDIEIIGHLQECFMAVWSTGDSMLKEGYGYGYFGFGYFGRGW